MLYPRSKFGIFLFHHIYKHSFSSLLPVRLFGTSRFFNKRNHYEVLNISQNSSQKNIKDAYFKLTKEFHPDSSLIKNFNHKNFIDVVEAYAVLSKPDRRFQYDQEIARQTINRQHGLETNAPHQNIIFRDTTIYSMRDKSKDPLNSNKPYYGISGLKRMSNWYIAVGAIIFMMIGGFLHIIIALKTSENNIQKLKLRDQVANENLKYAREQGKINGNAEQIRILKKKLVDSTIE